MKYKKMPLDRAGAEQWYRELNDDDTEGGRFVCSRDERFKAWLDAGGTPEEEQVNLDTLKDFIYNYTEYIIGIWHSRVYGILQIYLRRLLI